MRACDRHMGQMPGSTHRVHSLQVVCSSAAAGRRTTKQASKPKQPGHVQVDLSRLYTDATYLPKRQTGPIDVKIIKGKGRAIVATRELTTGELLMVSEPLGSTVSGAAGSVPSDEELVRLLEAQALSPADRFRLSLLCDGTPASLQRQITLKDLSDQERAQTKGTKSAAPVRGFGAAAQQQRQQQDSDLSQQRLAGIAALNAFGEEMADLGAAGCRGDPLGSYLGIWPEFALLNHSCVPNATHLLVGDRMLLRAAGPVPEGGEVTVSYLGGAAGVPLAQRRQMLQAVSGFECNCPRCTMESRAPEPVQQQLAAMHEWSSSTGAVAAAYAAQPGSPEAADLANQARFLVDALEVELGRAGDGLGSEARVWLRASAYGVFQAMHVAADGGEAAGLQASRPLELLMLTQVFMPGSLPALSLAAEALERSAEGHGHDSKEAKDALRLLMTAHVQRYGETPIEVFQQLLTARNSVPSYFGRLDAQQLIAGTTPAVETASTAEPGAAAETAPVSVLFQSQQQKEGVQPGATAAQLQALLDSSRPIS